MGRCASRTDEEAGTSQPAREDAEMSRYVEQPCICCGQPAVVPERDRSRPTRRCFRCRMEHCVFVSGVPRHGGGSHLGGSMASWMVAGGYVREEDME